MKHACVIGWVLLLLAATVAQAGERPKLQQPVVAASKLRCHTAKCLSLSSTVRVSDACWRTCEAHCAGGFVACADGDWFNNCRTVSDRCDLACMKRCRAYGGPLLDITDY